MTAIRAGEQGFIQSALQGVLARALHEPNWTYSHIDRKKNQAADFLAITVDFRSV